MSAFGGTGWAIFTLALLGVPGSAAADVTVLINEPIEVTGAIHAGGHVGVAFSRICADRLDEVRLCAAGEEPVVLTTYKVFTPDFPYYWVATPASIYLFGVEASDAAPIFAPRSVVRLLEREFSRSRLSSSAAGDPAGYWRYVVGATFRRTVYGFTLATTLEQDQRLVDALNRLQHQRRFDLTYNNCSDFARWVVNAYFPGGTHRDGFNDFSFTTPKAVARTMTAYGRKHPELRFSVVRYRQTEGHAVRSRGIRSMTEELVSSPKYLVGTFLISPYVPATAAAVYLTTGRFSFTRTFAREQRAQTRPSREDRQAFNQLVEEAIDRRFFKSERELSAFTRELDDRGAADRGPEGEIRLRIAVDGGVRTIGLSRAAIGETWSDPALSYRLALSLTKREADGRGSHAATEDEFARDLALLRVLRDRPGALDPVGSLACAKDDGTACARVERPLWKRILIAMAR